MSLLHRLFKHFAHFGFGMWLVVICVAGTFSTQALTKSLHLESSANRKIMIELFTSEGCSSCPPAEKWFSSLQADPGLWTRFIPISFHVDYWDHLGWKDPYSDPDFSTRQRNYASQWANQNVYTPQFVVNGLERGSQGNSKLLEPEVDRVGELRVDQSGPASFKIVFKPVGSTELLTVHGAILGSGLVTSVSRGENKGKELPHDFVALSLTKKSMTLKSTQSPIQTCEITFSPRPAIGNRNLSVAFWVTRRNSAKPIQAVGGELPGGLKW